MNWTKRALFSKFQISEDKLRTSKKKHNIIQSGNYLSNGSYKLNRNRFVKVNINCRSLTAQANPGHMKNFPKLRLRLQGLVMVYVRVLNAIRR